MPIATPSRPAPERVPRLERTPGRRTTVLRLLGAALAGVSPLAYAADVKLGLPMSDSVPWVVIPAAVALVALTFVARRMGARSVASVILVGLVAGTLGTAAYDGARLAAVANGYSSHDEAVGFGEAIVSPGKSDGMGDSMSSPPKAMSDGMGSRHTEKSTASATPARRGPSSADRIVGYLYHYWNGIGFAIAFLLLFGRRPWLAFPFMGVVVYGGMLWIMGSHGSADFVLELVGHLAFGGILAGAAWSAMHRRVGRHPGAELAHGA